MKHDIACVVVTYNRKEMLMNCLNAICQQTYKPVAVYIIDNASIDGTGSLLEEMGYKNVIRESINFIYHPLLKNVGGAGGFHEGMKVAYETNSYDAYWVMDDDGCPDIDCLKNLVHYMDKYSYISPLVLDIDNPCFLSFSSESTREIYEKYGRDGIINNRANPFNGILYRNDLVKKIGLPKRDMFIWGDEYEYHLRAISNSYYPVTIVNAVHKHPKDRMMLHKDLFGNRCIVFTDSSLRNYCKYRNTVYTLMKYRRSRVVFYVIKYFVFFIVQRKMDIKNIKLFISAVNEAFSNDEFKGHVKYV